MTGFFPFLATAIVAFIGGVWLTAVVATAAISHSQQWMQRKVRRWQDEAVRRGYGRDDGEWRRLG